MSALPQIADVIAGACLLAGAFLCLTAGVGLLRFPDVLSRMHAGTKPQVLGVLLDHFSSHAPLFRAGTAGDIHIDDDMAFAEDPEDADIVEQIKDLIETRVRPAVARDGGDIIYRGFDKGTVYLAMQGACSGCPSSSATLKQGIEQLLKHYVPEVTEVRAA